MKRFFSKCGLLIILLFQVIVSFSQVMTARYVSIIPNSNAYYEYLPQGYTTADTLKYPLIVSIHGAGDLGDGSSSSITLMLRSGIPSVISQGQFPTSFTVNNQTYRVLVIAPQFKNAPSALDINNIINYAVQNYKVDIRRIYLTGLSMGGGATWEYAGAQSAYANRLAAILPVCGLSSPTTAKARTIANANLPVWATHNNGDPTVPVSYTNDYISMINAAPAPVPAAIKTIFNNNIHDAWTTTFSPSFKVNNLNVYEWMLQYQRQSPANQAPFVNAGTNQTILQPASSVTLNGSATDADGTVVSSTWTFVSGPATPVIVSPGQFTTQVSNLTVTGTYNFRLTATDNNNATGSADVFINVNTPAQNQAPVANAGTDQTIQLPTSSVTLNGSGSDADGTIVSRSWTFVSGPVTPVIATPGNFTTNVSGLTGTGTYIFRLTLTDNNNATGSSNVSVNVYPPTGANKVINVNVFGTASYNNSAWNNWNTNTGSLTSAVFKYSDGSNSTINGILSAQSGYSDNGANYPVTMCPQQVGRDASWHTAPRTLTLNGLDNNKLYDLSLYASRVTAGQSTRFTINGVNRDIATANNYSNAASFTNISPSAGRIVITLTQLAYYNYINGFTITEKTVTTNQTPLVNAGGNQSIVLPATTATLAGTASDPDGSIVTYAWTQVSGTTATIVSPSSATTNITGLTTAGVRVFRLTVIDNGGATASADVTVSVTGEGSNQSPTANAGSDQSIQLPTATVTLNGSGTDTDGTIASYAWTQVSGTAATIGSPSSATTNITGLATVGVRVFRLTVTDNNGATATSDISISVVAANQPPVANGGGNKVLTLPWSDIQLNGSGNDPDGSIASFNWTQVSGTAANILTPSSASTYITGLSTTGVRVFRLTVTDNQGATGTSDVTITVNPYVPLPSITLANSQSVTGTSSSVTATVNSSLPLTFSRWTKFAVPGQTLKRITVIGSSTSAGTGPSVPDSSYVNKLKTYYKSQGIIDTIYNLAVGGTWPGDADITAALNKGAQILLVNYPSNNFSSANLIASIAYFQRFKDSCDARGVQFYCTGTQPRSVFDSNDRANLKTLNDSLRNRFGNRFIDFFTPIAEPSDNTIKPEYNSGDGTHVNNAGHEIFFQLVRAANIFQNLVTSPISIVSPSNTSTSITGLQTGTHKFQFSIIDNRGYAANAVISLIVNGTSNNSPTANAGSNQAIQLPASTVTLNGSGTDTDGSIASYAWSQVSGTTATIASPSSATTNITGLTTAGVRVFRLTVTDNNGATGTSDVTVTVTAAANVAPTANAGSNQAIQLPASTVTLNGSGTDTDGSIASYAWSQVSGTTATIASPSSATTNITGLATAGVRVFRLTVTDNNGATGTSDVTVTVTAAANVAPTANAGSNQAIQLPASTVTLNGLGTDTDGSIASYAWSQVSGTTATIASPSSATTNITGLTTAGVRVFRLTVTDNNGATGTSDVTVTVNAANQLPVANAGANQSITLPTSAVTLNGSAIDPDGIISTYTWSQVSGTTATITSPSSATTNITGLTTAGVRVFRLTVTDNQGGTGTGDVTIAVNNPATGVSKIINVNVYGTALYNNSAWNNWNTNSGSLTSAVFRYSDGSNSAINAILSAQSGYSDNGASYPVTMCPQQVGRDASWHTSSRTLTINGLDNSKLYDLSFYASRVTAGQTTRFTINGTNVDVATASNYTNAANFTNVTPASGRIVVTLTQLQYYNYLNGFTLTEKSVTSSNQSPTANAGSNQSIQLPASTVTLNGSGTDTDGSIAGYAWSQVSGTTATIASPSSATTNITGLTTAGVRVFRLTVTDNNGATGTSDVTVTVTAAANVAPTANAGSNQAIQLPASTVTLNGSGTDTDGSIASYAWSQVSGTTATIASPSSATTNITGLTTAGVRVFRLTVTDNNGATGTSDVTVTVTAAANVAPTANAGSNQAIQLPASTVTLNGLGTDTDGSIASYAWSQVSGTTATIASPSSATTNITGLTTAGVRVFRLTVTDNNGATGTSDVTVTVTAAANVAPTANAGSNQAIQLPASTVTLNGSGTDTDGSIASYAWSQVSGTTATIASPSSATTNITGLTTAGVRVFRLTVTDNNGATGTSDVTVTVTAAANSAPTANAGSNQSIQLPSSTVTLNGLGTDTDGSIASYAWSQVSGTTATIASPSSATTNITGLTTAGVRVFRLTVTDNNGATGTSDVTVTVTAAATGSTKIINVNIYGTALYSNSAWNNWNTNTGSLTSALFNYNDGSSSSINAVLSAQSGYSDNGASYPVTMCPQQVGRDASWHTSPRTLTINGLDNSKLYDLSLFASRVTAGQTTRYTINGTSIDIATASNYTNAANFTNIAPSAGRIVVTLTQLQYYNYINGFTLTEKTLVVQQRSALTSLSAPASADTLGSNNITLKASPNPVSEQFVLEIPGSYEGKVKVQVVDMNGLVRKNLQLWKDRSQHQFYINARDLSKGSYIIRTVADERIKSVRILKL